MKDWTPESLQTEIEANHALFVKLWKRGCGACKLSTPAIERLEQKYGKNLIFGQINVDDHPEMLEIADTDVLPCFFVFKDKKLSGKLIGFKGIGKLEELITSLSA